MTSISKYNYDVIFEFLKALTAICYMNIFSRSGLDHMSAQVFTVKLEQTSHILYSVLITNVINFCLLRT